MAITVEVTYDMSKALGASRFDVDSAATVADVVRATRERITERGGDVELLTGRAAIAVNGVLANHKSGARTRLKDGDVVAFVKAAAGG